MCFGAVIWAGIKKLIYCSTREDVMRHTDFDEGPLPENWIQEYRRRNIEVVSEALCDESIEVLKLYKTLNGFMY
jgi:tRNA(Arg) A34 adenosine deaminase TadA